jgi:hypothetical protein
MIATRSSRFEKASSQQVVGLCSTIARTERQLSNCGAQPPASKAIDFLVQDTRPLLPLVCAHRRQRPNPMANVVIETTNCNSCHPGHCERSDVHSFGMGGGRFNCRAPRARYAAGRKTLSLKGPALAAECVTASSAECARGDIRRRHRRPWRCMNKESPRSPRRLAKVRLEALEIH